MKEIIVKTWDNGNKWLGVYDYKKPWKKNKIKPAFKIGTNGARRSKGDTCLDCHIILGYLVINYTDFNLQRRRRVK